MSVSDTGTAEAFEIGRVLRRTFGVIGRNVVPFLVLSALLSGLPRLLNGLWQAATGPIQTGGAPAVAAVVVGGLLALLAKMVLQVALTQATIGDLTGDRPTFANCLGTGFSLLLPMIGLTILGGLGVLLALLLLVVPGLMLYVAWSVAVPVLVQERPGIMAAFGRSRALTEGARWKIFALLLILGIAVVLLQLPTGLFGRPVQLRPLGILFSAVVATFTSVAAITLQTAIYVELRDVKEGVAANDLETIFA